VKNKQPWYVIMGNAVLLPLTKRPRPGNAHVLHNTELHPCPELPAFPTFVSVHGQPETCGGPVTTGSWRNAKGETLFLVDPSSIRLSIRDNGMKLPVSEADVDVMTPEGATAYGVKELVSERSFLYPELTETILLNCHSQPSFQIVEEVMATDKDTRRWFLKYSVLDHNGNELAYSPVLFPETRTFSLWDEDGVKLATFTRSTNWNDDPLLNGTNWFCGPHRKWAVSVEDFGGGDASSLPALRQEDNRWVFGALITAKAMWDQRRDALGEAHTFRTSQIVLYFAVTFLTPLALCLVAVLFVVIGRALKTPFLLMEEVAMPDVPKKAVDDDEVLGG